MNLSFILFLQIIGVIYSSNQKENDPRIALYNGKYTQGNHKFFPKLQKLGLNADMIAQDDIWDGVLDNYDVFISGGGLSSAIKRGLEPKGLEKIQEFITKGGGFIGICGGAYIAINSKDGLNIVKSKTMNHFEVGRSILKVNMTELGKQIFNLDKDVVDIAYHSGPMFWYKYVQDWEFGNFTTLGTFQTVIEDPENYLGFVKGFDHDGSVNNVAITYKSHPDWDQKLNQEVIQLRQKAGYALKNQKQTISKVQLSEIEQIENGTQIFEDYYFEQVGQTEKNMLTQTIIQRYLQITNDIDADMEEISDIVNKEQQQLDQKIDELNIKIKDLTKSVALYELLKNKSENMEIDDLQLSAIITSNYGKGKIMLFGPHPENWDGIQEENEDIRAILKNAILYVGNKD